MMNPAHYAQRENAPHDERLSPTDVYPGCVDHSYHPRRYTQVCNSGLFPTHGGIPRCVHSPPSTHGGIPKGETSLFSTHGGIPRVYTCPLISPTEVYPGCINHAFTPRKYTQGVLTNLPSTEVYPGCITVPLFPPTEVYPGCTYSSLPTHGGIPRVCILLYSPHGGIPRV